MKPFSHLNAKSLKEAQSALKGGKSKMNAGGTDLVNTMKDNILPDYPELVVNLKTIPGLDYIKEDTKVLKIGALTRLADIADNKTIKKNYTALAQAAGAVASPHVREMGTISGNICQLPRCWYFRKPEVRFKCIRKGGDECFAMTGDNRYHSIFGAEMGCLAPNPGDTASALIALNAKVVTTKRTIPVEKFWEVGLPSNTVLADDEIIKEIQVPKLRRAKSAYMKFALRKSIDFPIVGCAVLINGKTTRIGMNAVAPMPVRATKAEKVVSGKKITTSLAEKAGEAAVDGVRPVKAAKYKVQIAKTLVKRTLLAAYKTK